MGASFILQKFKKVVDKSIKAWYYNYINRNGKNKLFGGISNVWKNIKASVKRLEGMGF